MIVNRKKIYILLIGIFCLDCLSISIWAQDDPESPNSTLIGYKRSSQDRLPASTFLSENNSNYTSGLGIYHLPDNEKVEGVLTNLSSRNLIRVVSPKQNLLSVGRKIGKGVPSIRDNQHSNGHSESSAFSRSDSKTSAPIKVMSNGNRLPASHARLIKDEFFEDADQILEQAEYVTQTTSDKSVLIGEEDSTSLNAGAGLLKDKIESIQDFTDSDKVQSSAEEERKEQ